MGWLGLTGIAYLAAILGQAALLRWRVLSNGMLAFLACGTPAGATMVVVVFRLYPSMSAWAGTLLYAFLCELWMFAFSSIFSSISANLMLHLRTRAMRRSEIDLLYDNVGMVRRRISWLCEIGAAEELDSRLKPTPRGRRLAGIFNGLRAFFGHSEEANRARRSSC